MFKLFGVVEVGQKHIPPKMHLVVSNKNVISLCAKASLSLFAGCGWLASSWSKPKPQRRAERGGKPIKGGRGAGQVKADGRAPNPYIRLPGARGKL